MLSRRARAHLRSRGVAGVLVAALTAGLVCGPTGAMAASTPAPDPSASPSAPAAPEQQSPSPTPIETSAPPAPPAPTDTAVPEPASPVTEAPVPDAADPAPTGPTPAPSEEPAPETSAAPADAPPAVDPRAPSARMMAADIGILAAGVPEQPGQVWIETFEQGLSTTAPSGITAYAGGRYTASGGWSNGANCTGVLVNYTATYPNASFCPSEAILIGIGGTNTVGARETRRMADVLGQVGAGVVGGTAASPAVGSTTVTRANHALTAAPYTAIPASNATVLQSATGIGVVAPNARFYTLRVDALGDECGTNNAALTFALLSGTNTFSPFPSTVVPCSDGGYYASTPALAASGGGLDGSVLVPNLTSAARAATYTGSAPVLLTPAQILAAQPRVTNASTASNGNAFAIDNLRVLDVTPALDAAFSPASVTATAPSTLTFTVTNRTDLLAKTDWGFTNALPAGLVVAPTPAIGGTCTNVTGTAYAVTAAAGGSSIQAAGGDLPAGATSCTITVNVVAAAAGTYASGTATTAGLDANAGASLTVTPATTITVRKNIVSRSAPADQFTLSLRSGTSVLASATTTGSTTGLQPTQISQFTVTPGSQYTIAEQLVGGTGITYSTRYECTRSGTVIASGASTAATITIPNEQGAQVVCTFFNTQRSPALYCDNSHFYSIDGTGVLTQVDIATGTTTQVASWAGVTTINSANSLGIGADGGVAYALNRSSDSTDVAGILKYTPGSTPVALANSAYVTRAGNTPTSAIVDGGIVAGALDLASGRFLFGKFNGGFFHLWSFVESTPNTSGFTYLGRFSTGTATVGNGDMAFDSVGNLFVLGAASSGTSSTATIFSVTASSLAAASGGNLPVNATVPATLTGMNPGQSLTSITGIAFSPRGTAYLSSSTADTASTGMYEFDATTWQRVPGTPRIATAAVDLASCASPASLTVQKNVVGRQVAADQFALAVSRDGTTAATAMTTGAGTGLQTAQIGPLPVAAGATLTISETMASGSTTPITAYTTVYECWSQGVRIATGSTTTGTVTMPDRLSASVNCTFFNSPRPASTITVTKQIFDPVTGVTTPGAGWTLGVTAAATAGTVTTLPSEAPRQQTDAAGSATWLALFGSAASTATLTILEEQRPGFAYSSASCTVNGTARALTLTPGSGTVSGTLTGITSASTIACTIVNRPVAALTLVKRVGLGALLPTDWTLTATGPTGALPGPSGRTGTAQTSSVPVTPGVAYRLSENTVSSSYVQAAPWSCVTAAGTAVPVTTAGDVTLAQGAAVTCTVTNATSTITLLKLVESPQPGFQAPNWTITATPAPLAGATLPTQTRVGAEYSAGGNPASTIEVRPGHVYTLSEAPTAAGSRLAYRTLRLERLDGTTWTPVASPVITTPAPGQTAVYRFVNGPVAPTVLPLTGGPSTDAFLIGGSVILALALAGAFWHSRRRTRAPVRGRL